MTTRRITVPFRFINVIMEQDATNQVFLFFQRVAADDSKYLAVHLQNADGTVCTPDHPLLENREMYEPRGTMRHPDGSLIVYGANRDRSQVIKIDVPGWQAHAPVME